MKQGLYQILSTVPPGGPDDYYRRNYKFNVTIAGKDISYVFCSRPFLEEWGDGSKLGFVEDDRIFISKNLHPTQVPFIALYFFYRGRDIIELKKEFGEETGDLSLAALNEALISSVLTLASDYLQPEQMSSLITKFKNEAAYDSNVKLPPLKGIMERYSPEGKGITAIVKEEEAHLDFEFERMSQYLEAYGHNKYVKRSGVYCDLESITGSSLFSADIARCERAFKEIIKDPILEWNLPGVVDFIDEIICLPVGEQMAVGRTESYILYTCIKDICDEEYKQKKRKYAKMPPVIFEGNGPEKQTNIVKTTKSTRPYFESLKKRLLVELEKQDKKARKAIKNIEEIVKTVNSGSEKRFNTEVKGIVQLIASNAERAQMDIKPEDRQIAIYKKTSFVNELDKAIYDIKTLDDGLRIQIAGAGKYSKTLQDAAKAKDLLMKLNLPTKEVDNLIGDITNRRYKQLCDSVGVVSEEDTKKIF